MRIISKYKDYYDYYVGVYGFDPNITYDRRSDDIITRDNGIWYHCTFPYAQYIFHICNKQLSLFEYKNEFYHTPDELLELNKRLRRDGYENHTLWSGPYYWLKKNYLKNSGKQNIYIHYNKPSTINLKKREPVLIEYRQDYYLPHLETFNFHKVYDAGEIYQLIYEFLSWMKDNPPIPNNQTDLEKILSHGFDKKISFRHRK